MTRSVLALPTKVTRLVRGVCATLCRSPKLASGALKIEALLKRD
jgi:hypothetical protein